MDNLTFYNQAASICSKVYNELKKDILNGETSVKNLTLKGNNRILEELSCIYKKHNIGDYKNIAYPVSISLNNCISNYVYDDNEEFNTIKDDSVIKIEIGVSVGSCISILTETFTIVENKQVVKINKFLEHLQKDITNMICHEETADEIRMYVESKCTEYDVFPVENCISNQQEKGFMSTDDSKYMVLNYKKYYDTNDNLISSQNINYEFEKDDVYTINLSVIPSDNGNEENIKYKVSDDCHIYRLNEYEYSLKLKSSRTFYSTIKSKHSTYGFLFDDYKESSQYKIGLNECLSHNIINKYPIVYVNKNTPVITKKFTIIVGDSKSKILKY
jgi:methionine aminopeptidase